MVPPAFFKKTFPISTNLSAGGSSKVVSLFHFPPLRLPLVSSCCQLPRSDTKVSPQDNTACSSSSDNNMRFNLEDILFETNTIFQIWTLHVTTSGQVECGIHPHLMVVDTVMVGRLPPPLQILTLVTVIPHLPPAPMSPKCS